MTDIHDRVAERMAMALMGDADAYRIMAKNRVRVVSGVEEPTIEHYRLALEQCIADKAADWRAACESAAAASKAVGDLKADAAHLRLTDAERFVLREVRDIYADEDDVKCNQIAFVLDCLLARHGDAHA
jgi:hypothetical protein